MHLLANILGDDFNVDLVIVDEAHKIGDNPARRHPSRCNRACDTRQSQLKIVFISPATQNPEELLTDAPPEIETVAVDSDAPTVLQNVIVADQVPRKPKLCTWRPGKEALLPMEPSSYPASQTGCASVSHSLPLRLASVEAPLSMPMGQGVRGGCRFDQSAASCDGRYRPRTRSFSGFGAQGVHPHFRLAPLVERGVAFHFGNMPSLIRLEIERLFRAGKIRFLVCTSTLIEGVNLSCRTIVLRGPRKGMGHPMEPHDFWNLAGRAGRWGDEFQGNIICINPQDKTAWPTGVPQRARYPIKRETDAVLELGEELVNYLKQRDTLDLASLGSSDQFEQVGAYLLTTFMRIGSISGASFAKRHDAASLARLDHVLGDLASKMTLTLRLPPATLA
jgi:hypothetical protein